MRRSSSMRRAQGVAAAGVKRRSLPLQVKYTIVSIFGILFSKRKIKEKQCPAEIIKAQDQVMSSMQ